MEIETKKEIIETLEISQEDFNDYEEVRLSGATNMFMIGNVCMLSGLSREKVKAIMSNYDKLSEEYK